MPQGDEKRAAVPAPSVVPGMPSMLPATVVTAPVEMTILRILLLPLSATYALMPSVAIPRGLLNRAAVPLASVTPHAPVVLPASVLTSPVAMTILRMLLAHESVTYRLAPSL